MTGYLLAIVSSTTVGGVVGYYIRHWLERRDARSDREVARLEALQTQVGEAAKAFQRASRRTVLEIDHDGLGDLVWECKATRGLVMDAAVRTAVDVYLKIGQAWAAGDDFATERQHGAAFDSLSDEILRAIQEASTGQPHPALGSGGGREV